MPMDVLRYRFVSLLPQARHPGYALEIVREFIGSDLEGP
jgi:hypothetical protein